MISAILSLRYNIPHRAAHILTPSLNLLIKSTISCSGGHSTPAFHISQYLSTIFEHLQLEPFIENSICCSQFFFLNGLTESVPTDQPHFQNHNEANEHDPPCTQLLGKFVQLAEPRTKTKPTSKEIYPNKTLHLSTSQKLAFNIAPAGWYYGNCASTSTIPKT
ncbi:hypothetical protein O181_056490 [Austropuccinia psidii MF-1]|uniref:Uncharacterized protein n=1 Tax=Austropuccinia psidii MF-1 TaxID=1389203 RepID=A0A9Q3HW56_9BASI|nr:hypothetical protein [Austropuccinia psidii MF-1]